MPTNLALMRALLLDSALEFLFFYPTVRLHWAFGMEQSWYWIEDTMVEKLFPLYSRSCLVHRKLLTSGFFFFFCMYAQRNRNTIINIENNSNALTSNPAEKGTNVHTCEHSSVDSTA